MSRYILPDFNNYVPQFIDLSIRKIKKSHLYNDDYTYKIDNKRYEEALNRLKTSENILEMPKRDIKVLSHYLLSLEEMGLFDKYYKILIKRINDIRNQSYFIRPLISYLYNGSKNNNKIYIFLKKLGTVITKKKERYEDLLDLFNRSMTSFDFLKNLKSEFSNISQKRDIDMLCEKFLLKSTDKIYGECIIEFIYYNYLDEKLWSYHKATINIISLKLKKQIFKRILLEYKDNLNTDQYPEHWFRFIYKELGDPYDPVNVRWNGLEDVKEIFRRWNIEGNIEKFFEQISGGDKRRKRFWKQYINNIYRIEYFDEASKALVMEFKDHLFVEFATSGNACYFYDKAELNINNIRAQLNSSTMSKANKIHFLKQGYDKKDHRGQWEYKFDFIIRNFGYKKSRWL